MTVTAEEDFRDFVIARWGELEPVAQLVTLDAPAARRVTTDALADLHGQWAHLLDEGMPGAAARRTVLAGALAAARHHSSARAGGAARPGHDGLDADPDEVVVTALLPVVRRAAPLERAVLAAATVWGLDPGRVADLLGMPPAPVRDADLAVQEVGCGHADRGQVGVGDELPPVGVRRSAVGAGERVRGRG